VDQFDVETVFLKQSFLSGDEHTALRSGHGGPIDAHVGLGCGFRGQQKAKHQSCKQQDALFHQSSKKIFARRLSDGRCVLTYQFTLLNQAFGMTMEAW
jgi:hypothetical protein